MRLKPFCVLVGAVLGLSCGNCTGPAPGPGAAASSSGGTTSGDGASGSGGTTSGNGSTSSGGSSSDTVTVDPDLLFAVVGDTRPAILDDTAGYPTEIVTK